MADSLKSLKQIINYPKNYVKGRLQKPKKSEEDLSIDQGSLVEINGKKVAAFRKSKDELVTLSPVCTHMGCIVDWNKKDKTWDCPCHGSRFEKDGKVKQGPAQRDLEKLKL